MSDRRQFLKQLAGSALVTMMPAVPGSGAVRNTVNKNKKIMISRVSSNFEREPLIRPFGFKGAYMKEIWQSASMLESSEGIRKIGLCTHSVLWSDASVFAAHSESGGNALMYAMTEHALNMINNHEFSDPVSLLDDILPEVHDYGKIITGNPGLRKTFALNSLVGVDNAAWLLYAASHGINNFDELIPEAYRPGLSFHHEKVACIPLMAYTIPVSEIKSMADQGYFFMKIKIGQPGSQKEMLEKDKQRLSEIHKAIGSRQVEHTHNGKIPYYLDANGRYQEKETLLQLIAHAEKIGAADQIMIIEEPFPEEKDIDVSDIKEIRIAADESAHTDKDALERIQMGYSAIALKAIAKTLSMTMKIAQTAYKKNVPCFCADLTVNPILVDWNKNIAARLNPVPGLKIGLLETNGNQNYKYWDAITSYHPFPGASWRKIENGIFTLDQDFYEKSGGIFADSSHYVKMFEKV